MNNEKDSKKPVEKNDDYDARVTHRDVHDDPLEEASKSSKTSLQKLYVVLAGFLILAAGVALGATLFGDTPETQTSEEISVINTEDEEPELTVDDIKLLVEELDTVWTDGPVQTIQDYDATNDNVSYTIGDVQIELTGNGLPNHATGDFPNEYNPNSISEQNVNYIIPRSITYEGTATDVRIFGVTLGGIVMEPGTAERDPTTGWSIEAFNPSRIFRAGTDDNNAHVQPNGTYHYHGLPTALLTYQEDEHSNLLGFAADGFPIYGDHGYRDPTNPNSPVDHMTSSWRLKQGERGPGEPAGTYTGDYTNDFEYIADYGDLDECNGRFTVTPEFPNGIYAYFITETFPFIGRCVKGKVLDSFTASNNQQMPGQTQALPSQNRP